MQAKFLCIFQLQAMQANSSENISRLLNEFGLTNAEFKPKLVVRYTRCLSLHGSISCWFMTLQLHVMIRLRSWYCGRLLKSTNGSDAIAHGLPHGFPKGFYNNEKDITRIKDLEWQKHIECSAEKEPGVLPFLSLATNSEAIKAEHNLDIFTKEVLIPLCCKTCAIVICQLSQECSLSMSFGRAANFLAPTYEG
jgi:hypothetical protein